MKYNYKVRVQNIEIGSGQLQDYYPQVPDGAIDPTICFVTELEADEFIEFINNEWCNEDDKPIFTKSEIVHRNPGKATVKAHARRLRTPKGIRTVPVKTHKRGNGK